VKLYTVHLPAGAGSGLAPGVEPVLVKEGFCWPAAIFSVFWALWHRLWMLALLLLLASAAIETGLAALGADEAFRVAASLGFALFVGGTANDWRRYWLAREGYRLCDIVGARNQDDAFRRWGDAQPSALI
tara:strand:- start:597 stop:986 length:390 start_codon:yes stop_codon:yes gene_type:complete